MQIVAAVSQKGGAGRTTLVLNLAAMFPGRVLVIDLDPQRSAYEWGEDRGEDRAPDVMHATVDQLEKEIRDARADGYDLILIDTPPLADREAARAAALADLVILPVRPSVLDLRALRVSLLMLKRIERKGLAIITLAPTQKNSSLIRETIDEITTMGCEVSPAIIRNRVSYQYSRIDARVAAEYEPGGPAAGEIALLLNDITKRLQVIAKSGDQEIKPVVKRERKVA